MLRGRGNLMKLLQEKGPARLQPERQLVAAAAEARQLPEEAKEVVCQVVEGLDQQPMWNTMGEQKARPSPYS
jgi:hypothetical protein